MPPRICSHLGDGATSSLSCFTCRQQGVHGVGYQQVPRRAADDTCGAPNDQDLNYPQRLVREPDIELQDHRHRSSIIPIIPGVIDNEPRHRSNISEPCKSYRRGFWSFWLPAVSVTLLLLPASFMLIYILLMRRVHQPETPFPQLVFTQTPPNSAWVFLDYSLSRLLFFTGLLSTIARGITGLVMSLHTFSIVKNVLEHSTDHVLRHLPTARGYGHLLAVISGSGQKLWMYLRCGRNPNLPAPYVVRHAVWLLTVSFFLATWITVADIATHYTSASKQLIQAEKVDVPGNLSFILSDQCENLNRTMNLAMPCSYNVELLYTDEAAFTAQQSEIILLSHNKSERAQLRSVPESTPDLPSIAIIAPLSENVPINLQFSARTTGVRTTCRLITDTCDFRLTGPDNEYWAFNCSPNFWGILGKQPGTIVEPTTFDQSILTYKPTNSLHFGFFIDNQLQTQYNTQDVNLTTGAVPSLPIGIPDDQLINPVHVGIAFRSSITSGNPAANYSSAAGFFSEYEVVQQWYGFALACSYEVFEVMYTWSNGSISDAVAENVMSGKLAEIYHGYHFPNQIRQLDINLQDAMVQATMEGSVDRFLAKWSELYSEQVVSVIGAFLVPDRSEAEQMQRVVLVAMVAVPLVVMVVVGSLALATLGVIVAVKAWSVSRSEDVRRAALLLDEVEFAEKTLGASAEASGGSWGSQRSEVQVGDESMMTMEPEAGKDSTKFGIVKSKGSLMIQKLPVRQF